MKRIITSLMSLVVLASLLFTLSACSSADSTATGMVGSLLDTLSGSLDEFGKQVDDTIAEGAPVADLQELQQYGNDLLGDLNDMEASLQDSKDSEGADVTELQEKVANMKTKTEEIIQKIDNALPPSEVTPTPDATTTDTTKAETPAE